MGVSKKDIEKQKTERIGEKCISYQGCKMEIVKYNNFDSIIVEFEDAYHGSVHTTYSNFKKGIVKNPYFHNVIGVGMIGDKYRSRMNGSQTKEYKIWYNMINRCYNKKFKDKCLTYRNISCCDKWLLYENFYEWLHNQENFEKWYNGKRWDLDKDIIKKNNKIYSPETCCLIPQNVNKLFIKNNANRGNLPIGVRKYGNKFQVQCQNILTNKYEYLGTYDTIEEAFLIYKEYKEKLIKQIAKIELDKGNITRVCYNAMMNYEVEIDD